MNSIFNTRRGMTIVEVAVALALLSLGVAMTAQVFALCARQRLAEEQLLAAQSEAANVLEHLSGLRYEALTSAAAQDVHPSSQLQAALAKAEVHVTVISAAEPNAGSTPADSAAANPAAANPAIINSNTAELPHKRIQVEITWAADEGPPHAVKLTAWKYPDAPEAGK